MNERLANEGRKILKELLSKLNEDNHLLFKRMYTPMNLDQSINDAVDKMEDNRIDWAISQCENTLKKNKDERTN